ncbi:MAG: VOC family protein [Coxiellaceae bacterium]|nr:VOC family protein [Coxiellaceae bacterium]
MLQNIFHLAIPCIDLNVTEQFYMDGLGCKLARRYNDRITLNFFDAQVVCHKTTPENILEPSMYPRHFGLTFYDKDEFKQFYQRAKKNNLKFFKDLFSRFTGKTEEHETFFLVDPANNLLEFKYYHDPSMRY